MKKMQVVNLIFPALFVLAACNPISSLSTILPSSSSTPSSGTSLNNSTSTNVDLSLALKTKADFINAYQCVVDNPLVSESNKVIAKTSLIVIQGLPEYAFTTTTNASYISFLKDFDLSKCTSTSIVQQPAINGNYMAYTCSGEGTMKSGAGKSINVNFINNSGKPINIYWLNQAGTRVNYKTNLANSAKHSQQTFVTHPWLITDNNGTCRGIYTFNDSTDISITGDVIQNSSNLSTIPSSSSGSTSTVISGTASLLGINDNLARLPGVIVNVSSEYSATWKKDRLIDGNLKTSWFSAVNDAANLGKKPYIELVFPQPVNIKGVNLKGNREYENGYDIFEGILTVNSQSGTANYNVAFPEPNRDFDIVFNQNINAVSSIKFEITKDQSVDPGLSEFEVVAAR